MAGNNATTVEYVPEFRPDVGTIPQRRRATDRPRRAADGIAWGRLIQVDPHDDALRRWWAHPSRDRRRSRR